MKRFFILASAAIVALASCAKTEVVYNEEPQEISFRQITGPMTKADPEPTVSPNLEDHHKSMGVDAIYHYGTEEAKSYFSNKVFEPIKSGETYTGDWKSNPASYWPLQGTLDFVVYAPYQESGQAYDIQQQDLTLILADNRNNQTDLMVGAELYSGKSYPATTPFDIPVTLEHALAKVTLKVKEVQATSNSAAAQAESVFYLKTVDLTATCQAGSVTVDYSAGATSKIAWTAATEDYTHTFSGPDLVGEAKTNLTNEYVVLGSLLVVPETASHNFVVNYAIPNTTGLETLKAEIPIKDLKGNNVAWEPGKHYIYNMTLTANEIILDPVVTDWTVVDVDNIAGNPSIE